MTKKNSSSVTAKKKPSRNWATIVYQESAPQGWQDILSSVHIPTIISPLHDSDVLETGEPKKPHYHVLFCFRGAKSQESVQVIIDDIGGVGCERIHDRHAHARYLCHLDNFDKARYSVNDVICIAGTDYQKYLTAKLTLEDSVTDVFKIVNEYGMTSYREIVNYCCANRPDLLNLVIKNAYAVRMYMRESEEKYES